MAEGAAAAPAAPSAPSAAPASSGADTVSIPAVPDSTVRLARPLKPIPELPGVHPDPVDDSPFPRLTSTGADSESPSPPGDATARPRGPDGRFLPATSSGQDGDGMHTLEPAEPAAQPAAFDFAGERFDSREAAEQNFRTLRGQYKPIQTLARSLGGVDKIVPHLRSAAESARAWKSQAEQYRAELEAARGSQPANVPADPAQTAEAPAESVDWELYAEIKRLATESGEPWKAEQWLVEQTQKANEARYRKMLEDALSPFQAQQAQQAVASQTETLFTNLAQYTNPDGSAAFPELGDESASYEVGRMWASLGLPRDFALTPQGAIAAIALYRMVKQNGSQARAAAQPTAATPPPPSPALPTDTRSAATLDDGRRTLASVAGAGTASAEAARIAAALRSAHMSSDRNALGFDA